jgi:hypothetical protein
VITKFVKGVIKVAVQRRVLLFTIKPKIVYNFFVNPLLAEIISYYLTPSIFQNEKENFILASACVLGTFASFVSLNSTKASAPLCDFVRCKVALNHVVPKMV